ncbi:MAG: DUF1704 domain-containing protein [Pirellulales bacterium]|nr:DUF1704 domain-containing protein [Pirellulales bacterium]
MMPESYITDILSRLAADKRVRRELPDGGRLYLDRRLPFICVYRRTSGTKNESAEQLIATQSAFLIMPAGNPGLREAGRLLRSLATSQIEHFEGFLIIEIWLSPPEEYKAPVHEESGESLVPSPMFRVHTDTRRRPTQVVQTLVRTLSKIRVLRQTARIEWVSGKGVCPPCCRPLLSAKEIRSIGCHVIGLEVRPVFQDPSDGEVFPGVVRALRRALGRVFNQTFHSFARLETNIQPRHYHTLGRRSFVKAVWEADRRLAEISSSFDLLLQATPTNAEAQWLEFRKVGFEAAPKFQYRPLAVDATELKSKLFQIPLDRIEDATLAHLFLQKQDELDRKITMLTDVGTKKFLPGSIQVYGSVKTKLVELASDIIRRASIRSSRKPAGRKLRVEDFSRLAYEEIHRYKAVDPTFHPSIEIRDDMYSGILVSQGTLLIGNKASFTLDRAEAILQHEIGTHLLTYHNGNCQPFRQLSLGLAGYDVLQEGLAVLAEYIVDGMSHSRLRTLAARMLAVKTLLDGASFVDTYRVLTRQMGFGKRIAYTITMRVHRAGGLTKDAVYLQGLVEIFDYLGNGGEIEPLLVGKIATDHIPLVEELRLRQILSPPTLHPNYLNYPHYTEKIDRIRRGMNILDLLKG